MNDSVMVIIPAYNEEERIGQVVRLCREHFKNVLCVDDGSSDNSFKYARKAGATVIRHPFNLGQGGALSTGFKYALESGMEAVVTFDADGQHSIEDALEMVEMLRKENVDAVLGSRFIDKNSSIPFIRRIILNMACLFTRFFSSLPVTDAHNGLRVLGKGALTFMKLQNFDMAHASEILDIIASEKLKYIEYGTTIVYDDYSKAKGQPSLNAFNIVVDYLLWKIKK